MLLYFSTLPNLTPIIALFTYSVISFLCFGFSTLQIVIVTEIHSPFNITSDDGVLYTETVSFFIPLLHVIIFLHSMAGFLTAWYEKYLTSCILFSTSLFWHTAFFCTRIITVFLYYPQIHCKYTISLMMYCYMIRKLNYLVLLECIFYLSIITLLVYLVCHAVSAMRSAYSARIYTPPSYNSS